jgi:hypothetical protein
MLDSVKYFAICLLLCVAAAFVTAPVASGDWPEYTTTAFAIASHATPDIRLADVRAAEAAFPDGKVYYEQIAAKIDAPQGVPELGFHRARNGQLFAWHFFSYPALVAAPLVALEVSRVPPSKAFVLANWAFVLVLALSLRRLFKSASQAGLGTLLFVLTGGIGYCAWTSPEWACAAALLSALALYLSDAPILAGLLTAFAASQNPSMAAFIGFAPLLRFIVRWQRTVPLFEQVKRDIDWRHAVGLAVAAGGAVAPYLFNWWAWGVPSLIASRSTSMELIGADRLLSFLFDPNQGLIIGFPAIVIGLLAIVRARRDVLLAVAAFLFTLVLALPTLTTQNWNSAAAGVMRYAFWSGMPLLFVLLFVLVPRWRASWALAALVVIGQVVATYTATTYNYLQMSPLAKLVLAKAPQAYNPDPEIFVERTLHRDLMKHIAADEVVVFSTEDGISRKALVHEKHAASDAPLCGPGQHLNGYTVSDAGGGWRYLNGPFQCSH